MIPKPTSAPHALIWISVLLGIPVLYALSIGPVSYLQATAGSTISQGSKLDRFYGPLGTAMAHTPLDEPLLTYVGWWTQLGERR